MSNHNSIENLSETICYDEDIHNKYAYILDTNNKDRNVEYFWFGFKTSIFNFILSNPKRNSSDGRILAGFCRSSLEKPMSSIDDIGFQRIIYS